jgi:hypothetical protein
MGRPLTRSSSCSSCVVKKSTVRSTSRVAMGSNVTGASVHGCCAVDNTTSQLRKVTGATQPSNHTCNTTEQQCFQCNGTVSIAAPSAHTWPSNSSAATRRGWPLKQTPRVDRYELCRYCFAVKADILHSCHKRLLLIKAIRGFC